MRKVSLISFMVLAMVVLVFTGCKKKVPTSDFSGTPTTLTAGQSVNFMDMSSGSPTSWTWTFPGGTPGTSTEQNPNGIKYNTPGTYAVTLAATNASGTNTTTKNAYITVNPGKTNVTFTNPTFTPISITFNGSTIIAPVGGSALFSQVEGTSKAFTAGTYETTAPPASTQIGEAVAWGETLTLAGGTLSVSLDVTKDLFYLKIKNSGTKSIQQIKINALIPAGAKTEDIILAVSTTFYGVGYYKAFSNSTAEALYLGGSAMWTNSGNLTMLINQSLEWTITSTPKSLINGNNNVADNGIYARPFVYKTAPIDPNAIHISSK